MFQNIVGEGLPISLPKRAYSVIKLTKGKTQKTKNYQTILVLKSCRPALNVRVAGRIQQHIRKEQPVTDGRVAPATGPVNATQCAKRSKGETNVIFYMFPKRRLIKFSLFVTKGKERR